MPAITLGAVGYKQYSKRQGRNGVFNHAGNVAAVLLAGLFGHFIAREWLCYAVVLFSTGSIISVLTIKNEDVDNRRARGAAKSKEEEDEGATTGFREIFRKKTILIFTLSVILFHFVNAAMSPSVGQYLSVNAVVAPRSICPRALSPPSSSSSQWLNSPAVSRISGA